MKPSNPDLVDRLAAEYVLGTLRGPARRRFERWRAHPAVEARCRIWAERLLPLAGGLRPVKPSAQVWEGIRRRLEARPAVPAGFSSAPGRSRKTRLPGLALAAGLLAAAGLGALLILGVPGTLFAGRLTEQATLTAPSGRLAWTLEVRDRALLGPQLLVRGGPWPARPDGRDYELWALPPGGQPVSLGVLPAAGERSQRPLSAAQLRGLAGATQIAVSVEPEGGSPTGVPTGAVVLTGTLQTVPS